MCSRSSEKTVFYILSQLFFSKSVIFARIFSSPGDSSPLDSLAPALMNTHSCGETFKQNKSINLDDAISHQWNWQLIRPHVRDTVEGLYNFWSINTLFYQHKVISDSFHFTAILRNCFQNIVKYAISLVKNYTIKNLIGWNKKGLREQRR